MSNTDESISRGLVNRLISIKRVDINPVWNGEFYEIEDVQESEGVYVKWSDIESILKSFLELTEESKKFNKCQVNYGTILTCPLPEYRCARCRWISEPENSKVCTHCRANNKPNEYYQ